MTKNGVCWKGGENVTPRVPRYVNTSLGVVAGFGRECLSREGNLTLSVDLTITHLFIGTTAKDN